MKKFFDQEIELLPKEEIKTRQSHLFLKLLDYAWENQSPYREILTTSGISRESITGLDDISKLPIIDKKDIEKYPPLAWQAAPDSDIIRINASSGTSGRMVMIPCTHHDVELFEAGLCRALTMQGCTQNSRVLNTFSYSMFIGGMGVQGATERLGATCIPTSIGNTERQERFLKELNVDILAATPSYAFHIIKDLARKNEINAISLQSIFVAGEPCSDGIQTKIEQLSGATVYDVYGNAEMTNAFASCKYHTGLHIPEDMIYAEIVDQNGKPLPCGREGELVITTLQKTGLPLIRYNTHDIAVMYEGECPCKRTSSRIKIVGRKDGMIIYKGCKFFPSDVDRLMNELDFLNGKYKLTKSTNDSTERIIITAELRPNNLNKKEQQTKLFADACRKRLGVLLDLNLVEPNTLDDPSGEKQCIFDCKST